MCGFDDRRRTLYIVHFWAAADKAQRVMASLFRHMPNIGDPRKCSSWLLVSVVRGVQLIYGTLFWSSSLCICPRSVVVTAAAQRSEVCVRAYRTVSRRSSSSRILFFSVLIIRTFTTGTTCYIYVLAMGNFYLKPLFINFILLTKTPSDCYLFLYILQIICTHIC